MGRDAGELMYTLCEYDLGCDLFFYTIERSPPRFQAVTGNI